MIEFLEGVDKSLFLFCNRTLANPVFDAVMPFLTDLNKHWYGLALYAAAWLLLVWKGGRKGRIVALFLIPLIVLSDQLSSTLIKKFIQRPRPCRDVDGVLIVQQLRLLVPCGSGFSFPSSHAVNNFAAATFLSVHYKRWKWWFLGYASVIAFTRPYVGVHYPSDALGGAAMGALCALFILWLAKTISKNVPFLDFSQTPGGPGNSLTGQST